MWTSRCSACEFQSFAYHGRFLEIETHLETGDFEEADNDPDFAGEVTRGRLGLTWGKIA